MKYFFQILQSDTGWIPGIHRTKTKREAVAFALKLNRAGVPVRVGYFADAAKCFYDRSNW